MPSLTIAKLLAGLALLAAMFAAGWTVNDWRWQSKYTARENVLLGQAVAAQAKYAADIKKQADDAEEAVAAHEEAEGKLSSRITALQEKARNAHFAATPRPSVGGQADCLHPFTTDLPRAINGLSDAAEGRDVPSGGTGAPSAAVVTDASAPVAQTTGSALVDWYADVARAYGECKTKLDAIRVWDAKP
jgi:hypothetical protein